MKKLILYLVVILVTFGVILYVRNPDLLNEIWIWVVGLFGVITGYIDKLLQSLKSLIKPDNQVAKKTQLVPAIEGGGLNQYEEKPIDLFTPTKQKSRDIDIETTTPPGLIEDTNDYPAQLAEKEKLIKSLEKKIQLLEADNETSHDNYTGKTYYLLRYLDDGETTLGMLFREDSFFSYTLEDTYRAENIVGKTRIPAGDYTIGLREKLDRFTKKYRNRAFLKGIFQWHLQLSDVPGFTDITIHFGGDSGDSSGSILISDGLTTNTKKKVLTNSKETYKEFYTIITQDLEMQVPGRVRIYDEDWFKPEILN